MIVIYDVAVMNLMTKHVLEEDTRYMLKREWWLLSITISFEHSVSAVS